LISAGKSIVRNLIFLMLCFKKQTYACTLNSHISDEHFSS
jgi:hypothetical protein